MPDARDRVHDYVRSLLLGAKVLQQVTGDEQPSGSAVLSRLAILLGLIDRSHPIRARGDAGKNAAAHRQPALWT